MCPRCRTERTGFFRYCRECGYDFETDARRSQFVAPAAASFEPIRADDRDTATGELDGDPDSSAQLGPVAPVIVAVVVAAAVAAFVPAYLLATILGLGR